MIREITMSSQDLLKGEIEELNIRDFNELCAESKQKNQANRESIMDILSKLKEIANIQRKLLLLKSNNVSYYNEAWNICEEFPDMFLNHVLKFESDLKAAYSELFYIVKGNKNAKIVLPDKKALYVGVVIDMMEEVRVFPFKGAIYSDACKMLDTKFEAFRETEEYDELHKAYTEHWVEKLDALDKQRGIIDDYYTYAMFNREKVYELEYPSKAIKVEDIA